MEDTADLNLVVKDPDKAYVSDMLWLPKSAIRAQAVCDALQYWRDSKDGPKLETLWRDSPHHILVPREFITTDQYKNYAFPFIDLNPLCFPRIDFVDRITVRANQVDAWEALRVAQGGILNLACGKGKTVLALKRIASLGAPALIVVNDGLQLDQWAIAVEEHIDLPLGEKVGIYQGKNNDWRRPITVAVINTLASRARDGELPEGFTEWFGSVWFDEVHHLSAPSFVNSAPIIRGYRFGLTATAERLDQLQWVYNYHIGNVFFSDLSQDLIPEVFFQKTPIYVDLESKEVRDKRGDLNISRLRSFLGEDQNSLQFRYSCIKEAHDAGRKILAISHSVNMLKELHSMFPGSGLVWRGTPQEERMDIVRSSTLCFAIAKLGKEALDDKHLDALFILTPFSSPYDLQQMLGRIQRAVEGKAAPLAMIFDDVLIPPMHALTMKLRKTLKKDKIPFRTLDVPTF